ncbi:hypothetical protein NUW54_g11364 [Trametes sanguinea]|uniref:Uncharacterized protein n=1 Tax=Trametes sanguinea TaxID=158606 RepID=A0ACC1NG83_9APHY|nr:hypothetical protein NUW54_g11364 [Trametes sanguinea]
MDSELARFTPGGSVATAWAQRALICALLCREWHLRAYRLPFSAVNENLRINATSCSTPAIFGRTVCVSTEDAQSLLDRRIDALVVECSFPGCHNNVRRPGLDRAVVSPPLCTIITPVMKTWKSCNSNENWEQAGEIGLRNRGTTVEIYAFEEDGTVTPAADSIEKEFCLAALAAYWRDAARVHHYDQRRARRLVLPLARRRDADMTVDAMIPHRVVSGATRAECF